MIIKPKVRGFVCVTAHPTGCSAHIQQQIDYVKAKGPIKQGPKKVLVIGASTGFGLSSRITSAFGSGAATLGIFYERPSEEGRPATPGWYNSIAFTKAPVASMKEFLETPLWSWDLNDVFLLMAAEMKSTIVQTSLADASRTFDEG